MEKHRLLQGQAVKMRAECREWLLSRIGEELLITIGSVSVGVSEDRDIRLVDAICAWREHVLRLARETALPPDDPFAWGVYDVVAALVIRDLLEEARECLPHDTKSGATAAVSEIDGWFEEYTEPDADRRLERLDGRYREDGAWWWRRVPREGRPRMELEQLP